MADFEISGALNIEQIVNPAAEAESVMDGFASSLTGSLGKVVVAGGALDATFIGIGADVAAALIPTAGAIQAAGQSAASLLASLGATGQEASIASTELSSIAPVLAATIPVEVAFKNALDNAFATLAPTASVLEGVVIPAEQAFITALSSSLEPIMAQQEELLALTPAEQAFESALNKTFSTLNAATPAFQEASSAEIKFSEQLDTLFGSLGPVEEGIGSLTLALQAIPGIATEAGTVLSALAEDGDVASEGLQSFYESLGGVSPGLETLDEAIAATGIKLEGLKTQLSGTAEQITLFGGSIGSMLTPEQEAAIALEEHEQGLARLRDTLVALQPALSAYGLEITDITSALRAMAEAQTGVGTTTTIAAPTAEVTQTTGSLEQLISTEKKSSESGMELSEVFENLLHVLSAVSKAAGELGSESAEQLSKGLEDVIGPLSGTLTLGPTVTAIFQGIKQVFDNLGPSLNSTTEGFNLLGQASRSAATEAAAAFAELAATPPPTPPTPPKPPVQAALPFPITDESLTVLSEQTAAVDSSTAGWEHYITTENQVTEASSATTVAISETDAALQELASAQASTASTTNQLDASLLAMAEAQTAIIEPIAETATQLGILDAGLAEMAAAQTQTATSAVELDEALGVMAEAQASVASAMDPVLAGMAEAQVEFASASVSLGQYNNLTAQGVVRHVSLQRAINVLNTELKEGAGNAEAVNAAYQKVQTAAQQLGYQIRETANGFTLFNAEVKASGGGISNINGLIGQVGGKMLTLEAGVGQLGFAFGLLARTLAPLNAVMVAAFPLISLVLVADIIQGIVDKFKKVEDEIRKTTLAFDDFASGSRSSADAIELTNLKLEDQINKLEGRPTTNKLQVALVESQAAADKLTKSLADSIEKALQLIEKSDVSFFKSLYTGLEPTSAFFGLGDSFGKAKQTLESYGLSVEKVRQAQLQLEKDTEGLSAQQIEDKRRLVGSNIALDEQAVSNAQNAAAKKEDAFKSELKALQNSINARREALSKPQEQQSIVHGQVIKTLTPALSEGELDKQFGQEQTAVTELQNAFDALDLAQQREAKSNRLRSDEARSSINDESYAREKLLSLPTFKGDLESGKETAASKKQQAEESFKISQEATNREIEEQVKTGLSRVQAEQNVAPQVIAARTKLRDALLDANKVQFDAELDFLTKEASLLASDPNQGRREADLRTNLTAQQKLRADNARTIQSIESGQSTALVQIDNETVKRQEQIERDYFLRSAELKISETRRGTSEQITAINEVMGAISSRYPEDYDLYAKYQKLKNQATVEFVQRQRQIQATEEEIEKAHSLSALESRRDYTNAVSSLEFSTAEQRRASLERVTSEEYDLEKAALERKIELYNSDSVEFERTRKELVALNDKYNRQIYQDTLAAWSDNEKPVRDFVSSSTDALNTFTENVFTSNQSIQRDLQSLFLSIVRDFTKMILEMIEKTALFKTIQRELEAGLNKIFRIPGTPAPPLTPGAGAAGVATEGFPSATPPPPTVQGVYPGVYPGVAPPAGSFAGLPTLPAITSTLGPAPPAGPAATSLSQLGQTPAENLEAQTLVKNEISSLQQIVASLQGQPGSEAAIADYNRQIVALKQQQVTQIQAAINAPKPGAVAATPVTAIPASPVPTAASSEQLVAKQQTTNAQISALYNQDRVNYAASENSKLVSTTAIQAQEVARTATSEAQKTATTSTAETQRSTVRTVATTKEAAQEQVGVVAHTTAEGQKTAATSVGILHRLQLELVADAKEIANIAKRVAFFIVGKHTETATHTASSAAKATSTVASSAAETASVAGAQAAQTAAIVAAKTAQLATTISTNIAAALSYSGVAGAAGTASWAGAPWPIDAGAPAFGSAMAGVAAGFATAGIAEKGAVLERDMPIFAHAKEMILPAHLSIGLQEMIASNKVEQSINAEKGGGSYLNPTIRREMEQSLKADFSDIRIHNDKRAADLSESLGAHAFTVGRDVFFNKGVYDEKSSFGRNVIAHELVHTIQHGEATPRGAMKVSHPNDAYELEAYSKADKVTREYFSKSDSARIEKSMLPMYEKGGDIYKDGPIYAHKGETVVSAFDTSRILMAAKAGAVMDSKLYKPSVSLSPSIVNLVNLAKLGMAPAKQLSVGSNVQLASSPQQDSHDNHNFNFNYNPQFGKDFNLGEHGPAIAGYMIQTLRRAGYKV